MRIFTKRKVGLIGLGIATGLALTAVVYAATFGPSRPTFTWANPAGYITFNSITDNPFWGDERYVIKARDASNPSSSANTNSIQVIDGQELLVTTYFHNNAKSNLNLVAKNTKVRVALPSGSGTNLSATSYISADNSNPAEVWATMDFKGSEAFTLEYVPGSAQLKTSYLTTALSDNVIKDGVLVGTYHPNGDVKGCSEFAGAVYFRVKVHKKEIPKPVYSCDILNVKVDKNRLVHGSVSYTAKNGATLSQVDWNWGDGIVEKNLATTANHTYAKDGTYTITTTLTFNVNGVEKKDTCTAKVTVSTPVPPVVLPETTLPKTGPGAAASVFAGASALGAVGHYAFRRFRS
ncbi:hypothetical protein A3F38_02885 [Candidatus Saccharibacteria bacterium RIFCSPHIGHO2_12_FULL_48_21]|nr:MAG: hypothetical protein A3F38_02885 [Candidatus Saccharibacteria bacterium RIFCSPHIGHO2_12_FULL_48_21]